MKDVGSQGSGRFHVSFVRDRPLRSPRLTMKTASVLVIALACAVVAQAFTVPLIPVHRTPEQKAAHYERLRNGEAARAVVAKYHGYIRSHHPTSPLARASVPTDPFKNYDDVRRPSTKAYQLLFLIFSPRTNTLGENSTFIVLPTPFSVLLEMSMAQIPTI